MSMDFDAAMKEMGKRPGKLAGFYSKKHPRFSSQELEQEAMIAIWEATKLYDQNKGAQFKTYATSYIKFKIMSYIKKHTHREEVDIESYIESRVTKYEHPQADNIELRKYDFKPLLKPRLQKFLEKKYGL